MYTYYWRGHNSVIKRWLCNLTAPGSRPANPSRTGPIRKEVPASAVVVRLGVENDRPPSAHHLSGKNQSSTREIFSHNLFDKDLTLILIFYFHEVFMSSFQRSNQSIVFLSLFYFYFLLSPFLFLHVPLIIFLSSYVKLGFCFMFLFLHTNFFSSFPLSIVFLRVRLILILKSFLSFVFFFHLSLFQSSASVFLLFFLQEAHFNKLPNRLK